MTAASRPPTNRAAGLPAAALQLLQEAATAIGRGQPDQAERHLLAALQKAPDHPELHTVLGLALQQQGQHRLAADHLQRSLKRRPNDPMTLSVLGAALQDAGEADAAIVALQNACKAAPAIASSWYNLGKAQKLQMRMHDAVASFDQALKRDPHHLLAQGSAADALINLGRIDEAIARYRQLLALQPDHSEAWHALANLKTFRFSAEETALLQRQFEQLGKPFDQRVQAGFAWAKALEDQGDYAASFTALSRANALKHTQAPWQTQALRDRVNAIMAAFLVPPPTPIDAQLGHELIFIASVPRSGSTLLEQMLASHAQIEGADEILDLPQVLDDESRRRGKPFAQWAAEASAEDWHRLGQDYLRLTARWRSSKPYSTDKNMLNWEHVGAIRAMLPGARIIRSHRDPVETCFACFRQLFAYETHYSYELGLMADYYIEYARLTDFWLKHYGSHVIDLSYERLVANPEAELRRVLGFVGLPFDPACLNFHRTERTVRSTASAAQVRQPLRNDTARGNRYEAQLAGLRERLRIGLAESTLAI